MASLSVGEYLFRRCRQLGIKSVFGVPGDYELVLLDMIPDAGLDWKGCPNELNASYAADGYGRINGAAAFVSTFGPGELSAFCGVAGQYTEYVPAVHIVGYPPAGAQADHLIMHHSLGDGNFGAYHEMTKNITVANTVINSSRDAATEIDRVLNAMLFYSRPVYIGLAVDVGPQKISAEGLKTPLVTALEKNDPEIEGRVIGGIVDALKKCSKIVIIVDGVAIRNRLQEETMALIKAANVPYFITAMSKGFDETHPMFGGVYAGLGSVENLQHAVESADGVLWIGSYSSDFNTGEFTERVRPEVVVDFQRHFTQIRGKKYPLKMQYAIPALTAALKASPLRPSTSNTITWNPYPLDNPSKPQQLTQDYLWPTLGRYLRTGDLVITETGTSAYGILAVNLTAKPGVPIISQTIFGSIGFATGCAVGAFVAGRESGAVKRPILITGEGSLQLTVQGFSDLMRHGVGATVFILNNDGYTIERLIHGMEASYNKVPEWNYSKLGALFGPQHPFSYYSAKTPDELLHILDDPQFHTENPDRGVTQVVELFLDKHDAPMSVKVLTAGVEEFNKKKAPR